MRKAESQAIKNPPATTLEQSIQLIEFVGFIFCSIWLAYTLAYKVPNGAQAQTSHSKSSQVGFSPINSASRSRAITAAAE